MSTAEHDVKSKLVRVIETCHEDDTYRKQYEGRGHYCNLRTGGRVVKHPCPFLSEQPEQLPFYCAAKRGGYYNDLFYMCLKPKSKKEKPREEVPASLVGASF